jgi:hypothetical protein
MLNSIMVPEKRRFSTGFEEGSLHKMKKEHLYSEVCPWKR